MNASPDVSEMEITAVVLLKLAPEDQKKLPRACKVCPDALWQVATVQNKPQVRCFCPMMHVFTYGTKDDIPILDCEHLYRTEEEEGELPETEDDDLPPHLRRQRQGESMASSQEPEAPAQDD